MSIRPTKMGLPKLEEAEADLDLLHGASPIGHVVGKGRNEEAWAAEVCLVM